MNPIRLSREEIKKLVFKIDSLNQEQRSLIVAVLERLAHSSDGHISPEELHKELLHLRAEYKISDIDEKAVTTAVFGS